MGSRKNIDIMLRNATKDTLLLASRVGVPLGYVLVVLSIILNIVALIHPSIERPPYAIVSLFLAGLVGVLFLLMLSRRAIRHEVRRRRDEPSRFARELVRILVAVFVGLFFWLVVFLVAFAALSRLTTLPAEHVLRIAVVLPMIAMLLYGCFHVRKEIASSSDSDRERGV